MKKDLSINDFSKLSGVSVSTLRYWDKIGLFSPKLRCEESGYRHYSPAQLIHLNFVTVLSDIHVPLKMIEDLGHERNPERFIELIDRQEKILNMEMRKLHESCSIIRARRELVNYGIHIESMNDDNRIFTMYRESKQIALWPGNEYHEGETFVDPLARFFSRAHEQRVNLSFPVGGYHESMESFLKTPGYPEHFFSIDPTGMCRQEAGEYLVGFARGHYAEMGDLPQRMTKYAQENSICVTGPVYTIYLLDELCIKEPSQYLAQSCVAVGR
ncbi:MAG: MerR family transcriptional regulator [Oscillospiraceae bacterium]|nr:MerR family transcriptional regulator [Oscillospiraceae bacterium]